MGRRLGRAGADAAPRRHARIGALRRALTPRPVLAFALMASCAVAGLAATTGPRSAQADPTGPGELVNDLAISSGCATCHAYANDPAAGDRPPHAPMGWQGSLMANSARDPVFWAAMALAEQDDPTHTDACVRCHVPNAFLQGRQDITAFDQLTPADLDGIGCDLCHRMVDDGVTPPGDARYSIDDTLVDGAIRKRGPFAYGVDAPPHGWLQELDFLPASLSCGTCHDVSTPRERVDASGAGMGVPFNEQRTFREWSNSAFAAGPSARSCQDCHMPAVEDAGGCAAFERDSPHPTGVRRHDLVGVNRFVTELLAERHGDAGTGEIDDAFWAYSLDRMDELAATAASLELEVPDEVDLGEGVQGIELTVTNLTGHKLPTGYSEGRVMWVELEARYGDALLWRSGGWDQGSGTIEDDPQLRRYEGIAEDADDGLRNHLLRNNRWVEDTRIPPRGLMPDPETDPVGGRYTLQDDGTWPHFDTVTYSFGPVEIDDLTPDDEGDDELVWTARLHYLINTPDYIAQLDTDNLTNAAGTELRAAFEARGGAPPVLLAQVSARRPLRGLRRDPEGGDAGEGAGTDDTASAGGDGDGCACHSAPPGRARAPGLGLVFAGLLLAVGRRRRVSRRA